MIPDLAGLALAPLLMWQGARVRRAALRLPEAQGPRTGVTGEGALRLRLLIVGDSSSVGVGAATQDEALAGQLGRALAQQLGGRVCWQLLGRTGHTSADALAQMRDEPEFMPADVLVTALGVNDATRQVGPQAWLRHLDQIDVLARERAGVRYTLHSAVPPMHRFPLLPQPLRWWMGSQARRLNHVLERSLQANQARGLQALPAHLHEAEATHRLMASDGFHPNPAGYALWAQTLAGRIADEWRRMGTAT